MSSLYKYDLDEPTKPILNKRLRNAAFVAMGIVAVVGLTMNTGKTEPLPKEKAQNFDTSEFYYRLYFGNSSPQKDSTIDTTPKKMKM